MARVFIMDMNAFDYTPAEAFGEIVVLRGQNFASGASSKDWNGEILHGLRKQLVDYKPMQDFMIPTGKPLRMCAISLLLAEHGPKHRFLAWDAMHYRYVPYTIDTTKA